MNPNEVYTDPKVVRKLEYRIILEVKRNLAEKTHGDAEMVRRIQKAIEEELKCYSNP